MYGVGNEPCYEGGGGLSVRGCCTNVSLLAKEKFFFFFLGAKHLNS